MVFLRAQQYHTKSIHGSQIQANILSACSWRMTSSVMGGARYHRVFVENYIPLSELWTLIIINISCCVIMWGRVTEHIGWFWCQVNLKDFSIWSSWIILIVKWTVWINSRQLARMFIDSITDPLHVHYFSFRHMQNFYVHMQSIIWDHNWVLFSQGHLGSHSPTPLGNQTTQEMIQEPD